jgi:hypothetical protein
MGLNSDARGVNVIGAVYELLTDPIFGLGLADSDLRMAGWNNALIALKDFRISPRITEQDDALKLRQDAARTRGRLHA